MKIEELISGKDAHEAVDIGGTSIPISALSSLLKDGYVHLKPEKESRAVTLWGPTCSACFTAEQLRKMA
jgi:hypothetical protein